MKIVFDKTLPKWNYRAVPQRYLKSGSSSRPVPNGELELELARVCQGGELPVEGKPSLVEGAAKQSQELAPEHAAEHAHRQEESWPAGDPARAIGSQPTSRHDAMHMRMVLEVLAPGVEDGQEPDLGPEVLGIGGDLPQGFGGGSEQKAVDLPLVLKRDRTERRREA